MSIKELHRMKTVHLGLMNYKSLLNIHPDLACLSCDCKHQVEKTVGKPLLFSL